MIVNHRRQQIVGRCDCMEIPREMEVHFLHWNNLRVTTAGSPAFHSETRAERRFADTNRCTFANFVQSIAEAYGGGCFSFACGGRVDRRNKDQFAVFIALHRVYELLAHFGFVMTIRQKMLCRNVELCTNFLNWLLVRLSGNFDIRLVTHGRVPFGAGWSMELLIRKERT